MKRLILITFILTSLNGFSQDNIILDLGEFTFPITEVEKATEYVMSMMGEEILVKTVTKGNDLYVLQVVAEYNMETGTVESESETIMFFSFDSTSGNTTCYSSMTRKSGSTETFICKGTWTLSYDEEGCNTITSGECEESYYFNGCLLTEE
ncbi:MAG: hypothetical protein HRT57_04040 [Crocinitomicaceae bacterium]|nr:hypothetical protein [Crocinitomicaceae bacterium]